MPELPEVETIRRQLNQAVAGQKITKIQVLRSQSFVGNPSKLLKLQISKIDRMAKMMIFKFKNHKFPQLLVHLRMTGQLIYQDHKKRLVGGHPTPDWVEKLPSKHTRVIIYLENGARLFFNDQRVFGRLTLVNNQKEFTYQTRNFVGIEPLTAQFTPENFRLKMQKTARPIKVAIMDQKLIAGVGNIYANDALWDAQINPNKPAKNLNNTELEKLRNSIEKVIALGIKYGGATDSDYRHLDGLGGKYQDHFLTYKLDGQPCQRCGSKLIKTVVGGRGTYWCKKCQK